MMEEESEDEDYGMNVCENMPQKDLFCYLQIRFEIDRGNDIHEYLNELSGKRYGNSLKEIDKYFQGHLDNCFLCKETLEDELNSEREMYNAFNYPDSGLGKIIALLYEKNKEQRESYPRLFEMYRQFAIRHIEMGN